MTASQFVFISIFVTFTRHFKHFNLGLLCSFPIVGLGTAPQLFKLYSEVCFLLLQDSLVANIAFYLIWAQGRVPVCERQESPAVELMWAWQRWAQSSAHASAINNKPWQDLLKCVFFIQCDDATTLTSKDRQDWCRCNTTDMGLWGTKKHSSLFLMSVKKIRHGVDLIWE